MKLNEVKSIIFYSNICKNYPLYKNFNFAFDKIKIIFTKIILKVNQNNLFNN